MPIRPIQFGDAGQLATRRLAGRLEALARAHPESSGEALPRYLRTLESLDRQYGGTGALPVEGAAELVAATLGELARLEAALRSGGSAASADEAGAIALGVALWALRHEVDIEVPEPVVNALAQRSNASSTPQELSAVCVLMHAVAEALRPRLGADLERSNPARPWRVLHANLAITAIRTEDPATIDAAFDALDAALPEERGAFYAEALALAMGPRIAPEVRGRIEARHRRWNLP